MIRPCLAADSNEHNIAHARRLGPRKCVCQSRCSLEESEDAYQLLHDAKPDTPRATNDGVRMHCYKSGAGSLSVSRGEREVIYRSTHWAFTERLSTITSLASTMATPGFGALLKSAVTLGSHYSHDRHFNVRSACH